jgi:16S rRNA (cytosine1402-N4)-methyltransferase
MVATGGKIITICFHSLEDRIAKSYFKQLVESGEFEVKTKKPIGPDREEMERNVRSRSARMRVAGRL